MGLFSKPKELCCVCGVETGAKRIKDGMVCKSCCSNCMPFMKPSSSNTKYEVQKAIGYRQTNVQRMELYNATKKVRKYFEIDQTHSLWKVPQSFPGVIFDSDELVTYELLQNGTSITKGGVGRAIAGGVLFGGVGAIVGGVTGRKTKSEVTELRIKIVTNNIFIQYMYIDLLGGISVKADSLTYKGAMNTAQQILSLLAIVSDSAKNQPIPPSDQTIEDLKQFKALRDDGIITQEEFEQKKKQLLNL